MDDACLACGDGPLLAGQLADLARDTDPQQLPTIVTTELTRTGWRWTATPHAPAGSAANPLVTSLRGSGEGRARPWHA